MYEYLHWAKGECYWKSAIAGGAQQVRTNVLSCYERLSKQAVSMKRSVCKRVDLATGRIF